MNLPRLAGFATFRKGHKDFITVLIDLDTHEIIDILEKRDKAFPALRDLQLTSLFSRTWHKFLQAN